MGSTVSSLGQWIEWLTHTNFSFLIGASHPHELVETAIQHSYAGMGITDFDGVYGIARTYLALKKARTLGYSGRLRLFYGAELHLRQDHALPIVFQHTIVLVTTSHQGYFNLCHILKRAHRDGKKNPFIPIDELLSLRSEGLVALQPMRGIMRNENHGYLPRIVEHFRGRFYFVISRHLNQFEDQWIMKTMAIAKSFSVPMVLSQDAFFHTRSRKDVSDILHAIRLNQTIDHVGSHLFVNTRRSLHSHPELERIYGNLPCFAEAVRSSKDLAQSIAFDLDELRYQYPKEMIPAGFTAQSFLEHLVWKQARTYYGDIPEKIQSLLQRELILVGELNFADYFLTVWDIVAWARQQNILCQGRGSAANSAICFVLGITAVDPNNFELLFERFMSVERGDPPDIDVDFEHERREEVIQYIYRRYGRERAAMVCNVICFKSKGSLRFVGKALGIPPHCLNQGSHLLHRNRLRKRTLSDVVQKTEEISMGDVSQYKLQLWADLAAKLKGFPRHLGIHSGGFMIAEKSLLWLVPTEPATMEGRTVVQWCKEDIEGLGFFKIDVLALGILTAIRKCLALVAQHYDKTLTLADIPSNDLATYAMIQKAQTVGVFQIESRAQMSFLPKHRPQDFYDLVVQVAIIRPGPIEGGMVQSYLRRRLGQEVVVIPDKRLEPILARTYGVPIFQEQVMRTAMAVGRFTPGEAEELRKNIGSFNLKGNVEVWIGKLEAGMRSNGIAEDFIRSIMGQIQGFASYGFPESHAASFALLAYASAYLKHHYPAAFFASLLNSQPMGFYSPDTLIKTAQHEGVQILPVCVQESDWATTISQGKIRLGLHIILGLSRHLRLPHPCSLRSLFTSLSRRDLSALAAANALQCFGLERRAALWLAAAAPFSSLVDDISQEINDFVLQPESEFEAVQADYAAISSSLGRHPTQILRENAWSYAVPVDRVLTGVELDTKTQNTSVFVFGMVLVRQAPPTAKGMLFITLEDETRALINLVIRPPIYREYADIIDDQAFLCVQGKIENYEGSRSLLVTRLYPPIIPRAGVIPLEVETLRQEYIAVRNYG